VKDAPRWSDTRGAFPGAQMAAPWIYHRSPLLVLLSMSRVIPPRPHAAFWRAHGPVQLLTPHERSHLCRKALSASVLVLFCEVMLDRSDCSRWCYIDPYTNMPAEMVHFSQSFSPDTLYNCTPAVVLPFLGWPLCCKNCCSVGTLHEPVTRLRLHVCISRKQLDRHLDVLHV
jgi:hypothetical protein